MDKVLEFLHETTVAEAKNAGYADIVPALTTVKNAVYLNEWLERITAQAKAETITRIKSGDVLEHDWDNVNAAIDHAISAIRWAFGEQVM